MNIISVYLTDVWAGDKSRLTGHVTFLPEGAKTPITISVDVEKAALAYVLEPCVETTLESARGQGAPS